MSESKPEVEQLTKALDALGEQWENVQVFCNRRDPDSGHTQTLIMGRGNYYARIGQVRDFVIADDAKTAELGRWDLDEE